jgi:hypothetical protein
MKTWTRRRRRRGCRVGESMMRPVNIKRVIAIATRSVPFVRVYSYQDPAVLPRLSAVGYLNGNHGHSCLPGPYRWMRDQMASRLEGFSGDLPVWAWLRRWTRSDRQNNKEVMVRITAQVPTSRILVSNFDTWHVVLNKGYLSTDEVDDEAFEAENLSPTERMARIQTSWQRVFQPGTLSCRADRYWQACIDRIHAHEVIGIRYERPLLKCPSPSNTGPDDDDDDDEWREGWYPPPQ